MKSYLSHLECTACHTAYSADHPHGLCPACGKVLYPRYDLDAAKRGADRHALARRQRGMWRFFEMMPVRDETKIVTMGEGVTPMLRASRLEAALGVRTLHIKDEGLNPTGSFKARGLSAAVSKAHELGLKRLSIPSAGNAAGALAAYCARVGMEAHVFMPSDAPEANKKETRMAAAYLTLVDGLISDAGVLARKAAEERNLFDVSTLKEPYRVEGKKTMGYEIAMDLGWKVPRAIVYPTGGGTGIVGIWKAFEEMEALGWIGPERPKMLIVQAEGCAPLVWAFHEGATHAPMWKDARTIAAGIRVPSAVGDYLILDAVRASGGSAVTVTDDEILEAMRQMASLEGILPAPEGAATLAGYRKFLAQGALTPDDATVLINTGSGYKYMELL
ncbi:MAG: threonine synthase [SAR202 cluster bacterium]|nr:threonine synthase [SAR202 cluster bacterium]